MDIIVHCRWTFEEGPRHYFDMGITGYGVKAGVGLRFGGPVKEAVPSLRTAQRYSGSSISVPHGLQSYSGEW
jgi:hypothetical protein